MLKKHMGTSFSDVPIFCWICPFDFIKNKGESK